MTAAHRICIQPTLKSDGTPKATEKGPLYDAIHQGDHICTSYRPLIDGARVLHRRGLTGPLEMWDHQLSHPRMRSTVKKAAQLTVVEGRNSNIRSENWTAPDRLCGLDEERHKRGQGPSGTSVHENASDGLIAEVEI